MEKKKCQGLKHKEAQTASIFLQGLQGAEGANGWVSGQRFIMWKPSRNTAAKHFSSTGDITSFPDQPVWTLKPEPAPTTEHKLWASLWPPSGNQGGWCTFYR